MRLAGVLAVLLLAGCVLGGAKETPGAAAGKAPPPNPILQGEIATTSLDNPAPAQGKSAASTEPTPASEATAAPAKPAEASAPQPPAPAGPQSPAEAKCLKSGGTWAAAGRTGAKACVKLTKDAGKSCSRQTQCESYCLARSRTCAPITPMFGCNDILQADGREVTLCID